MALLSPPRFRSAPELDRNALEAWAAFESGETLKNEHTLRAYIRAVSRFIRWCRAEKLNMREIHSVAARRYLESLTGPTKSQALAALRHFFDVLVQFKAVPFNLFAAIAREKQVRSPTKTKAIDADHLSRLIRQVSTSNPVGLRDRAIIGVLAETGASAESIAELRIGDLQKRDDGVHLQLSDIHGVAHMTPISAKLGRWIIEYLDQSGIGEHEVKLPLFRSTLGRTLRLTCDPLQAHSLRQMLKRRLLKADLPPSYSPLSFRMRARGGLLSLPPSSEERGESRQIDQTV
jgi:integrase/recombinase XerD